MVFPIASQPGRYPATTLASARGQCRAARTQLEKGRDPQDTKVALLRVRKDGTVRKLLEGYRDDLKAKGKRSADAIALAAAKQKGPANAGPSAFPRLTDAV